MSCGGYEILGRKVFEQLDRMESAIEHDDAQQGAEREIGDLDFGTSSPDASEFDDLEFLDPEAEAEARLEELKRRMGKD